jgi:hypothetical protein
MFRTFGRIITTTLISSAVWHGINHNYQAHTIDPALAPIAQGMNLAHDKLSAVGDQLANSAQEQAVNIESNALDNELKTANSLLKPSSSGEMSAMQYMQSLQQNSPVQNIKNLLTEQMGERIADTSHNLISN